MCATANISSVWRWTKGPHPSTALMHPQLTGCMQCMPNTPDCMHMHQHLPSSITLEGYHPPLPLPQLRYKGTRPPPPASPPPSLSLPPHLYVGCLAGAAAGIITAEGMGGCTSWQVVDKRTDVHTLREHTQHSLMVCTHRHTNDVCIHTNAATCTFCG
jgi:hypothetical protein